MADRANTKKPYLCVDCGKPVKRRVKRCPECHKIDLRNRPQYERTDEWRKAMSERQKGKSGHGSGWKHDMSTRRKMSDAWTPEMRELARQRGRILASNKKWRIRIAQSVSGANNPRWRGGISKQKYAPGFSKTLKNQIRARDKYTCQLCGKTESELGFKLSIHHSDYDKTNHDPDNLFSTCKRCNSLVNTNREYWFNWFALLLEFRNLGKDISYFLRSKVIAQSEGFIQTTYTD